MENNNNNIYQRGKIYKLVNNVDDNIYIGSSTNELYKRKNQHKYKSLTFPERNVYKHFNNIGWENVEIILIENYPCISKNELHARERHWIELLKPKLNQVIPTRTDKEYREDNKDKIKIIKKKKKK